MVVHMTSKIVRSYLVPFIGRMYVLWLVTLTLCAIFGLIRGGTTQHGSQICDVYRSQQPLLRKVRHLSNVHRQMSARIN